MYTETYYTSLYHGVFCFPTYNTFVREIILAQCNKTIWIIFVHILKLGGLGPRPAPNIVPPLSMKDPGGVQWANLGRESDLDGYCYSLHACSDQVSTGPPGPSMKGCDADCK